MKKPRKPKPMFPVVASGLLKNMARVVDKKRERRVEKRHKREARRLKHGKEIQELERT